MAYFACKYFTLVIFKSFYVFPNILSFDNILITIFDTSISTYF